MCKYQYHLYFALTICSDFRRAVPPRSNVLARRLIKMHDGHGLPPLDARVKLIVMSVNSYFNSTNSGW